MSLTLAAIGLAVVVIVILCVPLLRPRRFGKQRPAFDLGVYRDQLREVERDLERGLLNDDQAAQARTEISRRLLAADARRQASSGFHGSRKATAMVLLMAPVIPAAAVALYAVLGTPDMPDMPHAGRMDVGPSEPALRDADIAEAIERLESRLLTSPDDAEGWTMLGHSLIAVGRYADAHDALTRAYDLTGDPYVRADAAEARISANDGVIDPDALAAFEALRAADPYEPKSRFYIGLTAAQAGDAETALQEWIDLVVISPRDAPWLPTVRQQILRLADETGVDTARLKPSNEALSLAESASTMPMPSEEDIQNVQDMTPDEQVAFIRSMVERLAAKLEANPDDREGWLRLARAYQVLGESQKAEEAMAKARGNP